ncbi:hypothetical protein MCAMS1_02690 [biofilm metagenome]
MKKLFSLFLFPMVLIPNGVLATNRTVLLEIQNMTCPVCPLTIKKALKGVNGVQHIEIDYEAKTATVQFDDAMTTADKLAAATTNAGFPSTIAQQTP